MYLFVNLQKMQTTAYKQIRNLKELNLVNFPLKSLYQYGERPQKIRKQLLIRTL